MSLPLLIACTGSPASDDTTALDPSDSTASSDTAAPDDTADPTDDVEIADLAVTVHDQMGSILEVTWTQSAAATSWLEFSFDEDQWLISPPTKRSAGAAEERVLGAPFGVEVQLRLAWEGGVSETITATTDPLPAGAPTTSWLEGDAEKWDDSSPWVLTCMFGHTADIDGAWSFIVDRQGRVVWAKEADTSRINMQTQLSSDGTEILIDQNSFWAIFDGGASAQVDRVDIGGSVIETVQTPLMHHPFTELPDGTIAYGAVQGGFFEEELLQVIHPDGSEETLWSCSEFLDAEGRNPDSYCGSNTLSYSAATNTFLYSFFSLETVIEIDPDTGETNRYFGHTGADAWGFDPPESAFWWQHGAYYTDTGTVLLSSKVEDDGEETVLREYALDEQNHALVEVFSFGEGEGIYGDTMGEADYTPGGHILHNYGSSPRLREVSLDGEVVWDIKWDAQFIGRSTPLPDLYALRSGT